MLGDLLPSHLFSEGLEALKLVDNMFNGTLDRATD
jgi:hypothetical protein